MKISFEFDVNDLELHPAHLARILLDIQYLVALCVALSEEQLQADDKVFDLFRQKHQRLIEATGMDLGEAELTVSRIKMESPLLIEVMTKLSEGAKKSFITSFYYIRDHLLFVDLTREEKKVGIEARRQEVLERKIKNAANALDLLKKIPDPKLREEFINGLSRTLLAFATEHPPINYIKVLGDTGQEEELPSQPEVEAPVTSPSPQAVQPKSSEALQPRVPGHTEKRRRPLRRIVIIAFRILLLIALVFLLWNVAVYIRGHA